MAYQTLKYGTRVLVGLAIAGTTIYSVTRLQVKTVDFIEIMEGVRERQMIVSTITQTNTLGLQIASNRANLVQLDADIDTLIPNFVNQHAIVNWLADRPDTNPVPKWTKTSLLTYLGVGNGTNFTRTPAPATTNNVATFGAWPIQVYATDLKERYAVLQKLTYTTDSAQWYSNNVYSASWSGLVYSNVVETNFPHGLSVPMACSSNQIVADDLLARKPSWFTDTDTNTYVNYSVLPPSSPSSYSTGLAPVQTNYAWLSSDLGGGTYYAHYVAEMILSYTYTYDVHKLIAGWSSSYKVESRMKCDGKAVSIERIDYYYSDGSPFEVVPVSSNTVTTYTTNYVSPPDLSQADPFITVGYDISPVNSNYTTTCLDTLRRIVKYAYGQQTASEGNGTNKAILPVIHEWNVTRCAP